MVTTAGSLLGEMAPAPAPNPLTSIEEAQALAEESYRQQEIEEALDHLAQELAAIDKAIAAAQQNVTSNEIARMEAQIQDEPGKFSQPAMEIAALQAKKDDIEILGVQLAEESKVPGARRGLNQYNNNIGKLYGPPPEEQYSPPQQYENISFLGARAAPQTQAQQEATRQSFNVMDDAIRSAQQEATRQSFNVMDDAIRSNNEANLEAALNSISSVPAALGPVDALSAVGPVGLSAAIEMANFEAAMAKAEANNVAALEALAEVNAQVEADEAARAAAAQAAINAPVAGLPTIESALASFEAAEQAAKAEAAQAAQAAALANAVSSISMAPSRSSVEAMRAREAQEIMEQGILSPVPVSPPTPAPNPLGPARGVPLSARNPLPAFQVPQNQHELNAQPLAPVVEPTLLNPNINAINAMMDLEAAVGQPPSGLMLGTMPAGVPGFATPSPVTSMPSAMPGFSSFNAPQISAVTPISPVDSFFAAPEPVAPDANPVGLGITVSGVQSSVPGISISPPGLSGLDPEQSASLTPDPPSQNPRSASPGPPSPNPSRGKGAIISMMDVEAQQAQQQAQQELNAINAMMDLEAAVGQQQAKAERADTLSSLNLAEATPTTSRSSVSGRGSKGRSSGRSSKGAAESTGTRSTASWSDDNQISFSEDAEDSSDTGDVGGKGVVCSAMNRTYGFGSFRNKLWIEQSKNLDPAYERGYHAIALPLIAFAYAGKSFPRRAVKTFLEHAARRRTADIWKQKRGRRDWIGACERAIIEPICYLVGKMLGPKRGE